MSDRTRREDVLRRALVELNDARGRADALERALREPIAIVGIGCRFPGADSPTELWRLLSDQREAVREVPPERWSLDDFYDPDPDAPGKTYTRHGGFIDDVDRFDARFFGIPPREAASMDPQHRLLLEVAWTALEDGGIAPDSLQHSRSGVYVGLTTGDYAHLAAKVGDPAAIDAYLGTGNAANFAAGRLSYTLGLEGPSMVVDTACSSSLVSIHLACGALRAGEIDLGLAGGVNLMLMPETTVALAKARMLSPDGRCKTFDAGADGYVRAEGCGMLVLKRLSDAQEAGDHVLAVVRGSAVNQDGRSSGVTVPHAAAQEAVVRSALEAAGVSPDELDFVEAHGTGTPLGDPIELRALGRVLGAARERPLPIGSLKTNLGHLESAAGVASVVKAALALQHRELPAHLHFRDPSPHVDWDGLPIRVAADPVALPDGPCIGGVSSFGISGTNAHIVLEGVPAPASVAALPDRPVIVKLAAHGEKALVASAARLRDFAAEGAYGRVDEFARAASVGRADLPDRAALVATTHEELEQRLGAVADGAQPAGVWRGRAASGAAPKVCFLVPGQGSAFGGALAQMRAREPAVARALDEVAEVLGPLDRLPLASLLEPGDASDDAIAATEVAQPALYALAVALGAWWRAAGVHPFAVLGHSVGAYAAAALAGVMSTQDGARLVAERGRLMGELAEPGGMAAVRAAPDAITAALRRHRELTIACLNGPEETVVAGPRGELELLCADLAEHGTRSRMLATSHAFHSSLVEPALGPLARCFEGIELRAPTCVLVSDTTGLAADAAVTQPGYWLRHAREPVNFAAALTTVAELGCRQLVELGPATTLLALARRHSSTREATLLPSREPYASLARTWVEGGSVDWRAACPPAARRPRLPTYPFQRERHWIPEGASAIRPHARRSPPGLRPLRVHTALPHDLYRADLALDSAPVLREHRVGGHDVVPGVVYLELMLAAAEQSGVVDPVIEDLELSAPLTLSEHEPRELQIVIDPVVAGALGAHVHSRTGGSWHRHADATVRAARPIPLAERLPIDAVRARCDEEMSGEDFYGALWHPRFELGPSFRLVERMARRDGEALALLSVPSGDRAGPRPELLALDACVQTLVATLPRSELTAGPDRPLALGTGHRGFELHRSLPSDRVWCWAQAHEASPGELAGDIQVFDEAGEPVVSVRGVGFRRISGETLRRLAASSGAPSNGSRDRADVGWLRAVPLEDRPELVARYLADRVGEVVGMPAAEVDLDEPITSLADSLMLTELKTRIEEDTGIELPVEALFESPRIEDLARLLARRLDAGGGSAPAGAQAMSVAEMRDRARLDPGVAPRGQARGGEPRAVLLTGATGFLGAFLLDELLARTRADVHCLVRAGSKADGLARIARNLETYGLRPGTGATRIVPVPGDLCRPLLGLDEDAFGALADRVDGIYHAGAIVKWTYPYAALAGANVDGTRELLRLATVRTPLPLHFVSTVGVFSSPARAGSVIAEDEELERSGPLAVGYAQSKWVSERLVRMAAERGLPVTIHRPSIGPHSRTGAFNRHDHVALAISGCVQLGCAPESEMPVQIAPVEFVAGALVELSLRESCAGQTFHLVSRETMSWTELFEAIAGLGYPLATVPLDEWRAKLGTHANGNRANALAGLLPFLTGALDSSALPTFGSEHTQAALRPTGLEQPCLDLGLLDTYLDGLVAGGMLRARQREAREA